MSSQPFANSATPSAELPDAPARVTGERRFGRYALCYELASGGMGTVYLARAEGPHGFEKLVALKRIHPHLAKEPRFVDMFLDEARIAAQIHHPNVCSVIDFGEVDGRYYLTMPFLVGESLHRVLRAVRKGDATGSFLPIAARIVADACEGLHAAHELTDERGEPLEVVHRDVSPQNILVGYDGGVRILDFGVASARQRLYSTATGEVKGKFAYIAPEQVQAEAVDRRADVWSLGVVLYECIAGRKLFGKDRMAQTVNAVLTQPIEPLRDRCPDVPLALEEIVFKALARDPDRRYPTARAMGHDLLEYLAEERLVVGPGDVSERMTTLFPNGLAERRRMLEQAKSGGALDAFLSGASLSNGTIGEPTVVDAPPEDVAPLVATPARSGRPWLLAAALLATLAVGAMGAIALQRWTGDPTIAGTGQPGEIEPTRVDPIAPPPPDGRNGDVSDVATGADREAIEGDDAVATDTTSIGSERAAAVAAARGATTDPRDTSPETTTAESTTGADATEASAADEARQRARRAAADRDPGRLSVVTPGGWAFVYRGRRRLGESPNVFVLPAGAHVIGVQPLGRGPIRRHRVRIRPGETTRLVAAQ